MRYLRSASLLFLLALMPRAAQAQGLDTAKIDAALGRPGQKAGEVYRVAFPRVDLHVVAGGITIQPGFALGSWAAFAGSDSSAMVMGDLVLLPEEVQPVIEKLRGAGFEISAVHNHLLLESPRIAYVHYMGHGSATELAAALHSALAASATPLGPGAAPAPAAQTNPPWVAVVQVALAREGTLKGGVLSFSVPRPEKISSGGMELSPAQGVAHAINFQDAGPGKVAATGDFVLLAAEVNPVISAFAGQHIAVTALHSHMLDEQPRLFFMHFWAVGSPESVAAGIKGALALTGAR